MLPIFNTLNKMTKNLKNILHLTKKKTSSRTLSLLIFLAIFITLPIVLGSLKNPQDNRQRAQNLPNGSTAYPIYGTAFPADDLNPAWRAQTWYNSVNSVILTNTKPVYLGTHSISYT